MRITLLCVLLVSASGTAAEPRKTLEELGARLKQARSLPVGSQTAFTCPENLDQFKGVSMAVVLNSLGKPEYDAGTSHTYFLTSQVPPGQRGGGFPELTFSVNQSGFVEGVTCYYAK
jgi:hypothetical protein